MPTFHGSHPATYGLNYIWDVGTLSWVKETQPGGGIGAAVTIVDGGDVAQGTTTDAAITSDSNGTTLGFLRGLVKMVSSVWLGVTSPTPTKLVATTIFGTENFTDFTHPLFIAEDGSIRFSTNSTFGITDPLGPGAGLGTVQVANATPSGVANGLVTRNIPSGTQDVNVTNTVLLVIAL